VIRRTLCEYSVLLYPLNEHIASKPDLRSTQYKNTTSHHHKSILAKQPDPQLPPSFRVSASLCRSFDTQCRPNIEGRPAVSPVVRARCLIYSLTSAIAVTIAAHERRKAEIPDVENIIKITIRVSALLVERFQQQCTGY